MARKIVITSGKGGVGKTTICANLGVGLAKNGFRVLMVDADIGLNNLDVALGLESKVQFDVLDVAMGKCRPKQALVEDEKLKGLALLASTANDFSGLAEADILKNVIEEVEQFFDFVLIDCPAGMGSGFDRAMRAGREAVVVVTPHISSIRDADKVVERLAGYGLDSVKLLINRVRGDMLMRGEIVPVEEIAKVLNLALLGVVPDDDALGALGAIRNGAAHEWSAGARAMAIAVENVHSGSRKIFDCTTRYRGLGGIIRRNLKRRV